MGRVAVGAAAVVVAVGCLTACGASPEAAPAAPTIATPPSADDVGLAIASSPDPDWVAVTDEGAWVANVGPGLVRYDRDGVETASVETDQVVQAMQVAFDRLWLTSTDEATGEGSVLGVSLSDPGDVLRTPLEGVEIPAESSVAATDDAVWVHVTRDGAALLLAIDPTGGAVVREIPAPVGAGAVRGLAGSLWVSQPTLRTVSRVDPADGTVLALHDTGPRPTFLFPGDGAMWVLNAGDGTVSRLDAQDDSTTTVAASAGAVDGGDIVADDRHVWVRSSVELAVGLDTETLEVIGRLGPASGSGSIALDGDGLWISAHDVRTVWYVGDPG